MAERDDFINLKLMPSRENAINLVNLKNQEEEKISKQRGTNNETKEKLKNDIEIGTKESDIKTNAEENDIKIDIAQNDINIKTKENIGKSDEIEGNAINIEIEETFVSALRQKYLTDDDDDDLQLEFVLFPTNFSKSALRRTANDGLKLPRHLILDGFRITRAGLMSDVASMLSNVTGLDLTRNKLSRFQEVLKIISHLPNLNFLNISSNQHDSSEDLESFVHSKYSSIKQLALTSCKISWTAVSYLLDIMPNLTELRLCLNEFNSVDLPVDKIYPNVQELYISDNNIESWNEVSKLGKSFPNLTYLVAWKNPISSMIGEVLPEMSFQFLKILNINETKIDSWNDLESFKRFPSLMDLRILNLPFFQNYPDDLRRHLIIGYLPNITILNRTPVDESERCDAERAFIRHYMDDEIKPLRYIELVKMHGELDRLIDIDLGAGNCVSVMIYFGNKKIPKQLSVYLKVHELKKILSKKFVGQAPRFFNLYHNNVGSPHGHNVMNFIHGSLLTYGVKDGDEIYVELKQIPKK